AREARRRDGVLRADVRPDARPDAQDAAVRNARSALPDHLRRPGAERHPEPRRPGRLPVREADGTDVHAPDAALLGEPGRARRLVPDARDAEAGAAPALITTACSAAAVGRASCCTAAAGAVPSCGRT